MGLNKKADMSIALIISAVIGLIILVVALAIFGKGTGQSVDILESCTARGGDCIPKKDPCANEMPFAECQDSTGSASTELKCCLTKT